MDPRNRPPRTAAGASTLTLAAALAVSMPMTMSAIGCNDIFESKTCTVNGRIYPQGMTFQPAGDCNTCTCGPDGQVACTLIACDLPQPAACAFDTTYSYGVDGDVPRPVVGTLSPPAAYSSVSSPTIAEAAIVGCSPALPTCQDPAKIDASDIMRDLQQADVQAALAQSLPPFYGQDQRPVDGAAFVIHRADGHGALVGSPCPLVAIDVPGSCVPIPPGIQRLVDDLKALDQQQHMDPSCAAFNPAPEREPASP